MVGNLLEVLNLNHLILKPNQLIRNYDRGSSFQMNRSSLRSNQMKLETAQKLPILLEESIEEYTPIQ